MLINALAANGIFFRVALAVNALFDVTGAINFSGRC